MPRMSDVPKTDALRSRADENGEWAQVAFGLANREQDARELLMNAEMFREAANEIDRLRTLLNYAPHREACRPQIACTCWKAELQ